MRRRGFLSMAAGTAATGLLAGCSASGGGSKSQGKVAATVGIADGNYDPIKVKIEPGQAVKWVNKDGGSHTITAYSKSYSKSWDADKRLNEKEASFTKTFPEKGVYLYRCTTHTRHIECGAVLVGDVSLDESLPCE